jgi:hypothetical protein
MATPKRWGVRNVAKATMYDIATGKMLTYLENLKSSNIETTSETVYARGGDGNPKLIGFSSNKESKVTLSSAIFDNRAMALLTGNSIVTGADEVYRREVVTVTSATATLSKTPKGGTLLALYEMGADGVESTEFTLGTPATTEDTYSLATKTITVHSSVTDGTQLAAYFMVDTDATAQTITISSDKFPASFKLVMEVLVTDFYTKALYPAQIIIPSCKMEDNWSLSFAPDGDPQALELPVEILKPANSNDMWTMTIYSEDGIS